MKVAVSTCINVFKTSGTTVRARRVAEVLKNEHDLIFITRANEKQELQDLESVNVVIVRPDRTKLWNLKLIPIIIKNKFDIVYCSNDWFGFITYYLLYKRYRYKIIFEAHSILSEEMKELKYTGIEVKFYQILERFVIRHADYVVALSKNTFEFYKKYNQHMELIPVFINETVFKINKEIENNKYQRQECKLIGLIGPFDGTFNKYFLEFLYTNIKKFDSKIHFIVIGKCDNKIKNNRITYTGYLDSPQDYVSELSRLDGVIIPSIIATLGPLNKIIEPMSCSLPVFTTPKGMVGLYHVKNGKDIFVFEEDKIIDRVNELVFNGELMRSVGENARKVVEQYYSRRANEEKLTKILEKIVGGD